MSYLLSVPIDDICARGSIRDADVEILRQAVARQNDIRQCDAEALLRLHENCPVQVPAWTDYFVDAMTDFVVREMEPAGYLTAVHGGWLMARLSHRGRVRTKTELDLLVNVIEKARWAPASLVQFALAQIRDSVMSGQGPLRTSGEWYPGTITLPEAELVRTILFAGSLDCFADLTRAEVELVFEIDRCVRPDLLEAGDAGMSDWHDLVDKVVANAAMSASGYAGRSREEVIRRNGVLWPRQMAQHSPVRLVGREKGSILAGYRQLSSEEKALHRLERQRIEIITGEPSLGIEPEWLAQQVVARQLSGRSFDAVLVATADCGAILAPQLRDLAIAARIAA